MLIEKLLKDTKFKKDAADIARQLKKVGISTLEMLPNAPGLLRSASIWGHSLSEVIDAIKEAAEKPETKPEAKAHTTIAPEDKLAARN